MLLKVNDIGYNLKDLARRLGYVPDRVTAGGELSAARRFGGDYPRFHLYMSTDGRILSINLHLDQKKSSYEGTAAHGGEYGGETVAAEMNRIKESLFEG